MAYSPILAPVVALIAWTIIIMLWMALTRLPAMKKSPDRLSGPGHPGRVAEGRDDIAQISDAGEIRHGARFDHVR